MVNEPINAVTIAIVGAGARGLLSYAPYAVKYPNDAKIVAVAEPRKWFREEAVSRFGIDNSSVFSDWRQLAAVPKLADAVIIATQDQDHTEPALAFMKMGYAVLLEKPIAPTEDECRQIVKCAMESNIVLAVCHVLRYTPYFRKFKSLIDSGTVGQISTVRHIEQVGYWHFAHSYVRGNWRNERLASPMLLAKSCHDMDILIYLLGKRCLKVSSFGSLNHFRKDFMPTDAAERCIDCKLADNDCPYSAKKFYLNKLAAKQYKWPLSIITQDFTKDGVIEALATGPYGKCVYRCDNDVVDSQIVAMEFEGGLTANLTVTAFSQEESRLTDVFGSHGEIRGNGKQISVVHFNSGKIEKFDFSAYAEEDVHLGGDEGIMRDFIEAVRNGDSTQILSGPMVSLESHVMVFASERSRLNGTTENICV